MITIKKPGIMSYHRQVSGDLLFVEKGWCHYSHESTEDFLDYIEAYQPEADGVSFRASTFRGAKALVKVGFVSDTAFRFQMFPYMYAPRMDEAFSFRPWETVTVTEEELFITAQIQRPLCHDPQVGIWLLDVPDELHEPPGTGDHGRTDGSIRHVLGCDPCRCLTV